MESILSKDGTSIAYQRSGDGSPLILIHGAVADHTRWQPVLAPLEQQFTVYALDRRGRGDSGDAEAYALEREFEDIAAIIESIGEPVNVLAHSFGAFCALEAARLTSNIHKLILYEPPPPGVKGTLPPDTAARMQRLMDSGDHEGVISTFLLEAARIPPADLEKLRAAPSWHGRVAAAHTILRENTGLEEQPLFDATRFASVHVPTLLLLGGDSPALYTDAIRTIHAALSTSRVVILPGQQHVAMNTAPDLFVREVLTFLTDNQ